jgi:hypothetical protein
MSVMAGRLPCLAYELVMGSSQLVWPGLSLRLEKGIWVVATAILPRRTAHDSLESKLAIDPVIFCSLHHGPEYLDSSYQLVDRDTFAIAVGRSHISWTKHDHVFRNCRPRAGF